MPPIWYVLTAMEESTKVRHTFIFFNMMKRVVILPLAICVVKHTNILYPIQAQSLGI